MARIRQSKRQQLRARPSLVLYTTGLLTERLYLEWLRSAYHNQNKDRIATDKSRLRIDIKTSSDSPENTVSTYKRRECDYDYDEVWFIVDKDEEDLTKFVKLCKQYGYNAIISSPCFEVWLVAHYEQVGNFQTPREAQRRYKNIAKLEQKTEKSIPEHFPYEQMDEACKRSRLATMKEPGINEIPPSPSSAMPHLLRRLGLIS